MASHSESVLTPDLTLERCRAAAAAEAILPVLLVLVMWIGLFAMVGMQLFRCDYAIDDLCKVNLIMSLPYFGLLR